ncbi:membrane protein [Mycobacterium phage Stephig9]|uniref:Membrane protein n=1 Tax=Mycobacterium phage Stephig9 TaxID=2591224 RepID=A0A514DHB3_9CAUD|nr:membrane protein [Mycobacterium phage Stephig9]
MMLVGLVAAIAFGGVAVTFAGLLILGELIWRAIHGDK